MRQILRVLVSTCAVLALVVPVGAQDQPDEWEPDLRTERVYFKCADEANLTQNDNTMAPTWDTTPPQQSFVDDFGAGCRQADIGGQRGDTQDTVVDATWRGTYTGNLDTLNIDVHNVLVGPSRAQGALQVEARLTVDGEPVLTDGGEEGKVVTVVPQEANSGVTYAIRFAVTDIGLLAESEAGEHEIALTLSSEAGTLSYWAYDSTEVPSGILFNPPALQLSPTRVSAATD